MLSAVYERVSGGWRSLLSDEERRVITNTGDKTQKPGEEKQQKSKMLLMNKKDWTQQTKPYLVHLVLLIGFALYTVLGALIIQQLENESDHEGQGYTKENSTERYYYNNKLYTDNEVANHASRNRFRWGPAVTDLDKKRACVGTVVERAVELHEPVDMPAVWGCLALVAHPSEHQQMLSNAYQQQLSPSEVHRHTEETEIFHSAKEEIQARRSFQSFSDSIIFTFTFITTIGYGHVSPDTAGGRLFCLLYGLLGIPFAMLTIANVGKALTGRAQRIAKTIQHGINRKRKKEVTLDGEYDFAEDEPVSSNYVALVVLISFVVYALIGAVLLPLYEKDLNFFTALYFNFITLTTVGLGDIVPQSGSIYLVLTLIYVLIGLAITTVAIEVAADYLKKIHYYGRTVTDVGQTVVWFGGRKMTMSQLVHNLGDTFNVDEYDIQELNLDEFVETAIKVNDGQVPSIRKQRAEVEEQTGKRDYHHKFSVPVMPENINSVQNGLLLKFADEDYSTSELGSKR